jgi:hypothetical protein
MKKTFMAFHHTPIMKAALSQKTFMALQPQPQDESNTFTENIHGFSAATPL